MRNIILISVIAIFAASCSMQKRQHLSGYHVSWKKAKNTKQKLDEIEPIHINQTKISIKDEVGNDIYASNNNSQINIKFPKPKNRISIQECAEIITKEGDIIKGVVTEVGVYTIKYKKCENQGGPSYSIQKSKVFMIKYANGTKDVFKEEEEPEEIQQPAQTVIESPFNNTYEESRGSGRVPEGLGIASIALGILAFVFLFIPFGSAVLAFVFTLIPAFLAIILGGTSVTRISNDPERFMGKGFGITGVVLGVFIILLLFIFLALGLIVT